MRSGSADLPLHGGHVPKWLADRMTALGRVLTEAIVHHYGADAFLQRVSHPFWFQSLGAVMGMDWHSSGITTSVLGALKRGLSPIEDEIGVYVCGGRGKHSRKTPEELARVGERTGLDGAALAAKSRLVAKVDGACLQDGFELYLHGFFVARSGQWTVVQQGMNGGTKLARRYHWLSEGLESFVDDPHTAIEGEPMGEIVNLADARAARSRAAQVELLNHHLDEVLAEVVKLRTKPRAQTSLFETPHTPHTPHLTLPAHHHVSDRDVQLPRLHASLAAARERGPKDFVDILRTPGVGARTLLSLAMVAEVLHGAPHRFSDPARFSLAHGGKDGHPFPVPLKVYDETLRVLKKAVSAAKMGQSDRLAALKRLDDQSRALEKTANGPTLAAFIESERQASPRYGGRTVQGEATLSSGPNAEHRKPPAPLGSRTPLVSTGNLKPETDHPATQSPKADGALSRRGRA